MANQDVTPGIRTRETQHHRVLYMDKILQPKPRAPTAIPYSTMAHSQHHAETKHTAINMLLLWRLTEQSLQQLSILLVAVLCIRCDAGSNKSMLPVFFRFSCWCSTFLVAAGVLPTFCPTRALQFNVEVEVQCWNGNGWQKKYVHKITTTICGFFGACFITSPPCPL